ncbi:MAG: adenylate cyclase [Lachnospiraceae bacterium]|nr:adenylate cyclase [Lachnospiraceae bacterium]
MEIERKYLVKNIPDDLDKYEKRVIEQGYLCSSPTVRIRMAKVYKAKSPEPLTKYIFTFKSPVKLNTTARVNKEIEEEISEEGYMHLRNKCDNNLVRKTRYLIPLDEIHTAELDIFEGDLEGLVIVEVEFRDEKASEEFKAPDWFGEDVSRDRRYTNTWLSANGKPEN